MAGRRERPAEPCIGEALRAARQGYPGGGPQLPPLLGEAGVHDGPYEFVGGQDRHGPRPLDGGVFLGRYSRKDILCNGQSPTMEKALEGLWQVEESLKRRAHMWASGRSELSHKWSLLRRPLCKPFVGVVPASLKQWCRELRCKVLKAYTQAMHHWTNESVRSKFMPANGITRIAMESRWAAVENDKGPGWTLIDKEEYQKAQPRPDQDPAWLVEFLEVEGLEHTRPYCKVPQGPGVHQVQEPSQKRELRIGKPRGMATCATGRQT